MLGVTAIAGGMPTFSSEEAEGIEGSTVAGILLQIASALIITLNLRDGPLRPQTWELAITAVLAPVAAALFATAVRSRKPGLVTTGAFRFVRHPIYLAFLAMLLATGFVTHSGSKLGMAVVLYILGTELRIFNEERDLQAKFKDDYQRYCQATPWRYFPPLR